MMGEDNLKKFLCIICSITFIFLSCIFISCGNNNKNYIDLKVYYNNDVDCYNENDELQNIKINNFIDSSDYVRFSQIVFKNNPKWTAGLFIEYIEFDLTTNKSATVDLTLKISNLKQSETAKYNENYLWYFEDLSSTYIKENTKNHYKININETLNEGNGGFVIAIDKDSTLAINKELYYSISNLKISAYHKN